MKRLILLVAIAMLPLTGCMGLMGFDAATIEALAHDTATVCVSVQTPYGTGKFARTNIQQGNIVCDGNGLTVQSDTAKIGVPVTIVPNITIGAPTIAPR